MLRNVCSSNKGKALFNWFQLNGKLHFLDSMSFLVEGCLDPNGIMPQGETYAVSPIQLSYSPYSMSAVYAAPLVPVSVKFNSAQQGKRRPVWVKVLLQVPWVPTAEDVPCSTREKNLWYPWYLTRGKAQKNGRSTDNVWPRGLTTCPDKLCFHLLGNSTLKLLWPTRKETWPS